MTLLQMSFEELCLGTRWLSWDMGWAGFPSHSTFETAKVRKKGTPLSSLVTVDLSGLCQEP